MDVEFALHPSDAARGKAAIKEAREAGVTFDDYEKEIVWHCHRNYTAPGRQQAHIAKQVARAQKLWSKQ